MELLTQLSKKNSVTIYNYRCIFSTACFGAMVGWWFGVYLRLLIFYVGNGDFLLDGVVYLGSLVTVGSNKTTV